MQTVTHFHVLRRDCLPDGTELLQVNELPPPYESVVDTQRSVEDDWVKLSIEIQPLTNSQGRYGFSIAGGNGTEEGSAIVISHIESPSRFSNDDNGRSNLRLFDQICSINGIDLTCVDHEDAARAFTLQQGRTISLSIRRLQPRFIEYIDVVIAPDRSQDPLGLTINGGITNQTDDPGIFIGKIASNGLLAPFAKTNQLRIGDRILEIRTNRIIINLRWITRLKAAEFLREIYENHPRVTLVVAHRFP